ncbi:CGNR zinc finger domain-containing protein [Salinarimonas sp.]|uniref:CGNR zinc finger domain-containing protein n=1 Tax=Salinarimonas sp. TaxID=2766526 RepID=UPI0032D907D2
MNDDAQAPRSLDHPAGDPMHVGASAADALVLDFANSETGHTRPGRPARDALGDAFATLAWLRDHGALEDARFRALTGVAAADPGAADVFETRTRRLRAAIVGVLRAAVDETAPAEADLAALGAAADAARAAEVLAWDPQAGRAVRRPAVSDDLAAALWPVARAAEGLVSAERLVRVKRCASSTCDWFFLDTSKNRSRRWCRMEVCGNREKGRRRMGRARAQIATQ